MHKLQHHFFEFTFRHLTVADCDSCRRNERLNFGGDFPDCVDAVMDEIDLAPALEFLLNGGLDQLLVPTGYDGLDRQTIFRGRFDHAHVAQADERHVQSARDGRGRHSENVHLLAHLLDALFVADAEALLLVDDEQAEIGEFDVFGKDTVRSDEDVDLAGFGFLQDFFLLL